MHILPVGIRLLCETMAGAAEIATPHQLRVLRRLFPANHRRDVREIPLMPFEIVLTEKLCTKTRGDRVCVREYAHPSCHRFRSWSVVTDSIIGGPYETKKEREEKERRTAGAES